jgi:NAD-specific glutamate dehydrogenase
LDERERDVANEIWRLGQRVLEVIALVSKILTKFDADTERAQQRGWETQGKLDALASRVANLERLVIELERVVRALVEHMEKRQQQSSLLADLPPYVKVILTLVLSAFVALATGKALLPP